MHTKLKGHTIFLWDRAVHSKVKVVRKIWVQGWGYLVWGLSIVWFAWVPCTLTKKNKQSWTRTPRDASGFLPLKLKLDATSKLLSCPFFIYFIYMALDAKTFSFAHSHCDHQSKGWVLKEYKQNHKPRHNFQQNSICNLERLLLLAMLNTFQKTGIPDICLLTFILSLR